MFQESRNEKINFQIEGNGDLNLVWIHGFGGDLHIWDRTIEAFSQFKNFRFDYLGHGKSHKDISPEKAVSETICQVAEILEKNLAGPIVWIGHSFAGNLLLPLANSFTTTKAAIFLDCSCLVSEQERNSRAQLAQIWSENTDPEGTLESFYDELIGPEVDHKTRAEIKFPLSHCDPQFLIEFYGIFNAIPPKPNKKFPTLIFEAEHFSAKEDSRSFIQYFPESEREIIEDGYHFFFYQQPELYNQKILNFIEKLNENL